MSNSEKLQMRAYYYGFSETGVRPIDLVLRAVSAAGNLFHHTDQWTSEINYPVENVRGLAPVDWIQNAADDAAEAHKKLIAERDTALADLASAREECERLRGELARRPWVDPDEDEPVEPTWEEEATPEEINAQQMLDHGLTYFDKP